MILLLDVICTVATVLALGMVGGFAREDIKLAWFFLAIAIGTGYCAFQLATLL